MKLKEVTELWQIRQRAAQAAAQEAAHADARQAAAERARAAHEVALSGELAQAQALGLWQALGVWHHAAERRLHELRGEAGQRAREAAAARDVLRAALTEAERFATVTRELEAERRAELARRGQLADDEAALRRRMRR